ncbi:MAG TPA: MFS transporter [Alphaproteobacteria bacterium]|nr:MFS transporter [Alphaproteobacteria bacterium]
MTPLSSKSSATGPRNVGPPRRRIAPRLIVRIGVLRALANRNYRIYAEGNAISMVGTWVQRVAVGWLTWELTGSTMWLGLIAFAELLPTVIIGPFAGVVADRFNRLRLFKISQILAMTQSALLFALTATNLITIELLFALTLYLGAVYGFAQPVRLSLIPSLVRRADMHAAIACNSLLFNLARFLGPILAGLVIVAWGIAPAFLINMTTYCAVLYAAALLRPQEDRIDRSQFSGMLVGIQDGITYAFHNPAIRATLILFACTAAFGRPFAELLPGFAADVFERGALGLAWLTSSVGFGAVLAAIYLSQRRNTDGLRQLVVLNTGLFGFALIALVSTKWFWLAIPSVALAGFAMVVCAVGAQSLIQDAVDSAMRGRVLSLYGLVFRAGVALGSLIVGALAADFGLPWPIGAAALACVAAALIARTTIRNS